MTLYLINIVDDSRQHLVIYLCWELWNVVYEDTMKKFVPVIFFCFLLTVALNSSQAYDFPFTNPYVATVIGTPLKYSIPLPEKMRVRQLELTVFEDREIPDVFWYLDKLNYSLAYQKKKAPLIFVIAGTGASHRTANMQLLQKILNS